MHELVAKGLKIMRDPSTMQTTGVLRRESHDGTPKLCAMGCIAQAAVDAGLARWYYHEEHDYYLPVNADDTLEDLTWDEIESEHQADAYEEALNELSALGCTHGWFIARNDAHFIPLPKIADSIDQVYAGGRSCTS